jgi:hypothetical protein
MYKYTSNGNVTYFQNMPQQSTNICTNTNKSWDLHFCIVSSIIIGKTMTQVTDTITGKLRKWRVITIFTQFNPIWYVMKENRWFCWNYHTSYIANSTHHFHHHTFLYKYPGNYAFSSNTSSFKFCTLIKRRFMTPK